MRKKLKAILVLIMIIAVAGCKKSDSDLVKSSIQGDTDKVRLLLSEGKVSDDSKVKALMFAAARDHTEIVQTLLEAGVNVNATDERGTTALLGAVMCGYVNTMQILIDAGANPNIGDDEFPILILAVTGTPLKIKEELEKDWHRNESELHEEVAKRHIKVIQLLLSAGADVNSRGAEGFTPLIASMLICDIRVIEALIDAGANVNVRGRDGMTALMVASMAGKTSVVQILIDAGADVNAKFKSNETALTLAASNKHFEIVRMLIAAGATE
jgi:ankyrin repeat protein